MTRSRSADIVSLEVGGKFIDTWTEYRVESDLLTPADAFHLTLMVGGRADRHLEIDTLREILQNGATCRLYVGRDVTGAQPDRGLQLSGVIDDVEVKGTREGGTVFEVVGRDAAAYLVDSDAPLNLLDAVAEQVSNARQRRAAFIASGSATSGAVGLPDPSDSRLVTTVNVPFCEVVRAAVAPWGINVITDASTSRDMLTGRWIEVPGDRRMAENARAQGINPALLSRGLLRRAIREGRPADELAGVSPTAAARARAANGLAPGDIERLRLPQAKPNPGETVWAFLERHARRLGVLMWMNPRGQLVLGAPNYNQVPLYRFVRRYRNHADDPNTILSGGAEHANAARLSEVRVYGRTGGNDALRSPFSATAIDPELPFERVLIVQDQTIRSVDEARRRAMHDLAQHKAKALTCQYQLPDHGLGRYLYAIDTMATVLDEEAGVAEDMYVTRRAFTCSRAQGTLSEVSLMAKDSVLL